jgi:predicted transcriptional regulator
VTPPVKKLNRQFMLRLDAETLANLEAKSEQDDRPVSWLIRTAIDQFLDRAQ